MNDQERESVQRDLSDALAALQQGKPVSTLDGLADHLVKLGGPYRFHGALIQGALTRRDHGTINGAVGPGARQAGAWRVVDDGHLSQACQFK